MFKKISHIEIVTNDLERSVDFYTNVLGVKIAQRIHIDMPPPGGRLEVAYLDLGPSSRGASILRGAVAVSGGG